MNSIILILIISTALILFISNIISSDLVALIVLALLVILRLIDYDQALSGFASPATATIAAMFVMSTGLVRTGIINTLSTRINSLAGRSEMRLLIVLMCVIALLSALIVNTATVAIFIPVAIILASERHISASKVLIPLSFASQFGGVCTLIGTSTNILVNSLGVQHGLSSFRLFEFAPLGLAMSAAGITYLALTSRWLLPKRRGESEQIDKYRLADYVMEFVVQDDSPLVGTSWRESSKKFRISGQVTALSRDDTSLSRPLTARIKPKDVLVIYGNAGDMMKRRDELGLAMQSESSNRDTKLVRGSAKLVEVLIPPRSKFRHRTIEEINFHRRFGSRILALQRRGRIVRHRLSENRLEPHDTLLLESNKPQLSRMLHSPDLIVTSELPPILFNKNRTIVASLIFVSVITVIMAGLFPIHVAAIIGAIAMVASRCLSIEEAYEAIDWKVIFLLGGMIPLGSAFQNSGLAGHLTNIITNTPSMAHPTVALALLYITTALLTELISNNATAVLLAPLAFSMASSLGVNPAPFLVAITFAASTSFTTPMGYQTNIMVFAPGGYRFTDYIKIGLPLNCLFWMIAVLLIPHIWPF